MDIATLTFYLFAFFTLFAGAMVISVRNPVHSVLFLIFAFFNAAGLFVLLGAEYLAMTLVIVYVGAVAILFLFVVMMLNVNLAEMRQGFLRYLPAGLGVAAVLLMELFFAGLATLRGPTEPGEGTQPIPPADQVTNAHAIGNVLYTDYFYLFQLAGLILLVAMIGSIVLTLRHRSGVRRQKITEQLWRRREECVALVDVETGKGV